MALLKLLNCRLSWHERNRWDKALILLEDFFENRSNKVGCIKKLATAIMDGTNSIDMFIQQNSAAVCPGCEKVCCINLHSYHDYQDLIYIFALGSAPPGYRNGIKDTDPCQFIGCHGCTIDRSLRPFRCNWYFCDALLKHMENGPAKPYRQFIGDFHGVIELRREMLEEFFSFLGESGNLRS